MFQKNLSSFVQTPPIRVTIIYTLAPIKYKLLDNNFRFTTYPSCRSSYQKPIWKTLIRYFFPQCKRRGQNRELSVAEDAVAMFLLQPIIQRLIAIQKIDFGNNKTKDLFSTSLKAAAWLPNILKEYSLLERPCFRHQRCVHLVFPAISFSIAIKWLKPI